MCQFAATDEMVICTCRSYPMSNGICVVGMATYYSKEYYLPAIVTAGLLRVCPVQPQCTCVNGCFLSVRYGGCDFQVAQSLWQFHASPY